MGCTTSSSRLFRARSILNAVDASEVRRKRRLGGDFKGVLGVHEVVIVVGNHGGVVAERIPIVVRHGVVVRVWTPPVLQLDGGSARIARILFSFSVRHLVVGRDGTRRHHGVGRDEIARSLFDVDVGKSEVVDATGCPLLIGIVALV